MRGLYKTLTHLQIGILTMKSHKTNLLFTSQLYTYHPITDEGICNIIIAMFWLNDGINIFFNTVHGILWVDCLAIQRDVVINNTEFF